MSQWQPIETCDAKPGERILVYRPLAHRSSDDPIDIKRYVGGNGSCWESTVPDGDTPFNPTDGACHVTHWMPLPKPPEIGGVD